MTLMNIVPKRWITRPQASLSGRGLGLFDDGLEQLLDHFFSDWEPAAAALANQQKLGFVPRVNVAENEQGLEVTAELPGLDPKDVEISLEEDKLVLKGEKKQESEKQEKNYTYRESVYGSFHRVIPLAVKINPEKTEATFQNGVLKVKLAKVQSEAQKSKRIEIKS